MCDTTSQTSAKNCPMNVAHMRAMTDHAIPEFLLSDNSALEKTTVAGLRAEWHFPNGKVTYLQVIVRSVSI